MQLIFQMADFFLHIGEYLAIIIEAIGPLTYVFLFLIIFAETGLVITPFLPGDSLIFVVGTFTGTGLLNFVAVYITLLAAAIIGDSVNYWIGNKIGPRVFSKENSRVFNKKYLAKTHDFYEKYGSKTIVIARFVPIVRTFAPFVAGIGSMKYKTFITYNVIGAFLWVTSLLMLGHFLGSQPIVKNNFEIAIFVIIGISLIPMIYEFAKKKMEDKKSKNKKLEDTDYKEIKEIFEEKNKN